MPDLENMPQPTGSAAVIPPAAAPSPAAAAAPAPAAGAPGAAPAVAAPAASPVADEGATGINWSKGQIKHNWPDKMLHGILGALGGTESVEYSRDPETGQLQATRAKLGPGQQFKRIIAGALTGLAAGSGVEPGPGHKLRGLNAGFKAGEGQVQGNDTRRRKQADEDFEAQQSALVRRAQVAHLNQSIAEGAWRMTREQAEFDSKAATGMVEMRNLLMSDPQNQDWGVYPSFDEFLKKHGGNGAQIGQMNANMELRAVPEFDDDRKLAGVHIYQVNPGWNKQKNAQPVKVDFGPKVGADGKAEPNVQTIPAGGASNEELTTWQQAGADKWLKYHGERAKAAGETEVTPKLTFQQEQENKRTGATNAAHLEAARVAAASRENVAKTNGMKSTRQDIREHDKAYVQPAEGVEKSWQMMDGAYKEWKTAHDQGKELPSGAQSMLALSTHLSTTFGNVKGSRITKDMIEHHLGARGISDAAQVAIQRLTNGDGLAPAQWEAFHALIAHSRQLSWETAAKQARRKGVPIDFLPDDLQGLAAPKGATAAVKDASGAVIGHVVNGQFMKLGEEK